MRWTSNGENEYTIETFDRPKRGTKVILHLRDDMNEFLNSYRLKGIITKYSDHISLPIVMDREEPAEDDKNKVESGTGEEIVNSATALWTRNKKDIKQEEYDEFYKHVGPVSYTHLTLPTKA